MNNWKQLIEQNLAAEASGGEASFGEPASEAELSEVESALKITLPAQLREVLGLFNGVTERHMGDWILFDTENLIAINEETRANYADWDLSHPVENAVAFSDIYGTGDLCAICLKPFGSFQTGEVVLFDHETGEYTGNFDESAPDLATYFTKVK